jgi:hypothetical protein
VSPPDNSQREPSAGEFSASLPDALIAVLPGIDAAPTACDPGRLAAAATAMSEPSAKT